MCVRVRECVWVCVCVCVCVQLRHTNTHVTDDGVDAETSLSFFLSLFMSISLLRLFSRAHYWVNKWRTRMEPRRPPVCKILLPPYRAPRLPCVLAGHKTSVPCVIDAYVALLSWLLVLVVFFPIGSSAWQCFV